jgi:hypothetical protein
MERRKSKWLVLCGLICLTFVVASCGGGGGGAASLAPPAFTNLAGTSWDVTDTVSSSSNSCFVPQGTTDLWTGVVATQSGNSLTVYDTRAGAGNAVPATISGYVVTFSGSRYPVGGCSDMRGSYNVTINAAGTSFSGTAVLTCLDDGCTVPINVFGSKN